LISNISVVHLYLNNRYTPTASNDIRESAMKDLYITTFYFNMLPLDSSSCL